MKVNMSMIVGITILQLLTGCNSKKYMPYHTSKLGKPVYEKLNIEEYGYIKPEAWHSTRIDREGYTIYNHSSGTRDSVTKFDYAKEYKETGEYFSIKGDVKEGFTLKIVPVNSEIGVRKAFFGNGNLKTYEHIYFRSKGHYFNHSEFPIGISYEYDIDGNLIKQENLEKHFKFNLKDVKKYENKLGGNIRDIVINRKIIDNRGIWFISFVPEWILDYYVIFIGLSGKNGAKVYENRGYREIRQL